MGRVAVFVMVLVMLGVAGAARGQDQPTLTGGAVTGGVGFQTIDHWGVVRLELTNPSAVPMSPLATVNFDDRPTLLFAYDVWLPAQTRRRVLLPVRPTVEPRSGQGRAFSVSSRLIDTSEARERPITRPEPSLLLASGSDITTAILASRVDTGPNEAVATLREAINLAPTTMSIRQESAPPIAEAYASLDMLAVASNEVELDPAQIAAMRQWLFGGGRIWIMLDQVEPTLPERLLGDYWRVARVDEVGLVEFAIEAATDNAGDEPTVTEVSSDYPVRMVRVVPEGFEVTHRVNGYPAAMRRSVGRGELLVTTLEPQAWMRGGDTPTVALADLTWMLRGTREAIGSSAGQASAEPPLLPFVRAQIGYRILDRSTVIFVLGGFTVTLLVAGVYLSRRRQMEYAAVLGAVLAVFTAAAMVGLGLSKQLEESTLAAVQVVRYDPHLPVAHAQGTAGVYQPQGVGVAEAQLRGEQGAMAWPDLEGQGGDNVRMVFRDPLTWRFEQLGLPSGAVQSLSTAAQRQVKERPAARVRFTLDGLEGEFVAGEADAIRDALIVGGGGVLPAVVQDGQLRARIDQTLAPDQYVAGAMLSQEQMLRQDAYRRLLSDPQFIREPSLVGWSTQVPLSVSFRDDARRQIDSLVVVPLEIAAPEPGEEVAVPGALMPMAMYRGKSGGTVFNPTTREWIADIGTPQRIYLTFELPHGVKDMEVTGGQATLDINAAGWQAELLSVDARNDDVVLATRDSPLGTVEFDLSDNPPRNVNGHVVLGVRVQPIAGATAGSSNWTINRLSLSVRGRIPGRSETSE